MDGYVDYSGQAGFHETDEEPGERSSHQAQLGGDAHRAAFYNANVQPSMVCDIKPRLTKSQHEMLEAEYTKQNKPSTSTKKGFAEALGVSLDKVNNWFQNRRAKSKQDAKKAAGAYNLYQAQQAAGHHNYSSDSDTSPAFASDDYFSMMQQCSSNEPNSNGVGISDFHPAQYTQAIGNHAQPHEFVVPHQIPHDMFDSPQEMNRRTLTQEQFDAFAHNGGSMELGNFDMFNAEFSGNQDVIRQVFPQLQNGDVKQQHAFAYPSQIAPSLSSHDSSIPSTTSDQSMAAFPSSWSLQGASSASSASSEWADSRSSSVPAAFQDEAFPNGLQQPTASTSQWQPGQSVPVDINALSREFQQAAQARQAPQPYQAQEQPLAWPADDAYERRDSQTSSMLAQSMSHVGLQTPQPQQTNGFKSPVPPTSIAARRQRPRPAALGIASMRSQSYSGAAQPGSPGQMPPQCLTPGQPGLRRIRSSNVVGGVAQGRVQKPLPGAPQRSPLAWSFADAMNSPKAIRHASGQPSGSLAPPTPLTPNDFSRQEQNRSHNGWHPSHHVSRQPSISESDFEQGLPGAQVSSAAPQNFSSPPHTPMYHQQAFVQQRIGSNVITENTPPQSAPATQQSFSAGTFAAPQYHMPPYPPQSQASVQQFPAHAVPQQPQYMNAMVPEPQFQVPSTVNQPHQSRAMVPTSSTYMQYPQGVPMVNAQGQLELVIPQFVQQPQHPAPVPSQHQQINTPPRGGQFEDMMGMFSTATPAPALQVTAQLPKQPPPAEFFVHEYSPPAELKRSATPRKTIDTGPKSYSFANHGPQDFEKKKGAGAKVTATASSSPASNSGSGSNN